jgi:hypothetical protein
MGLQNSRRSTEVISSRVLASVLVVASLIPMVSAGWIDMETPLDKRTTTSFIDGSEYHLVRALVALIIGSYPLCTQSDLTYQFVPLVAGHVG